MAATGAVEIVDFKGHYGLELGEPPALLSMYERVVAAFPDTLLEDAHDLPEVAALLEPEAHRISYDAPIYSVQDLDTTPLRPRAVNIKPCRVGGLRSLFDVYAVCEARGLVTYGGGMGELDVGRGQIQVARVAVSPGRSQRRRAERLPRGQAGGRPAVQPAPRRPRAGGVPPGG